MNKYSKRQALNLALIIVIGIVFTISVFSDFHTHTVAAFDKTMFQQSTRIPLRPLSPKSNIFSSHTSVFDKRNLSLFGSRIPAVALSTFRTTYVNTFITRKVNGFGVRGVGVLYYHNPNGSHGYDQVAINKETIKLQIETLEHEIFDLHNGTKFNLASPKQVADVIYGPPNNPDTSIQEDYKKLRSTSKESLTALLQHSKDHSIQEKKLVKKIIEWRSLYALQKRYQSTSSSISGNGKIVEKKIDESKTIISDNENSDFPQTSPIFAKPQRTHTEEKSPFEIHIETLFDTSKSTTSSVSTTQKKGTVRMSQIDNFWKQFLLQVDKPSAKNIIFQLHPDCPMGYDPNATPNILSSSTQISVGSHTGSAAGKKGSLLEYVRDQKRRFPDAIILTRVGEFYESYGIDAIALMQCCGLNPMAGKARAGCPIKNIQATLDGLTSFGFRVAVYEEASDTNSINRGAGASGGSKSRLKNRMLAQIISSASPMYMYDIVLDESGDMLAQSSFGNSGNDYPRNHVGVIKTSAGYTIVEISSEERSVRVSERLTSEAVACRLAAYPPADPLFYVPAPGEEKSSSNLPFLPSRSDAASEGPGSRLRVHFIPGGSSLMQEPTRGISDVERAKKTIVSGLLNLSPDDEKETSNLSEKDFVLVGDDSSENIRTQTSPLYVETATQLGLMSDPTIPSLIQAILPDSAPVATRRFLQRWLLTPPPSYAADAMASLVRELKCNGPPLPPLSVPPVGKVLSLIRAGQASAPVYREVLASLTATISVLETFGDNTDSNVPQNSGIISPLMKLLEHESGIAAEPKSLLHRCMETKAAIEKVVNTHGNYLDEKKDNVDRVSDVGNIIPRAFFERNELIWRGRILPEAAKDAYNQVERAVNKLTQAVAEDFWGSENVDEDILENAKEAKNLIVQDIFNNRFACKAKPSWIENNEETDLQNKYFHPRDRNGKIQRNRYTTEQVERALSDYIEACDNACKEVKLALTELSKTLCDTGLLPAVVQAAHLNLILSTTVHHSSRANAMGWSIADLLDSKNQSDYINDESSAGYFKNVWPYWMDQSSAVKNSFDLNGLFLLTAPNMSGKSTLMRSTAAAALLTNCGLCAPLEVGSKLRRFDSIFVRGASADVPSEGKSAFGAEMGDIAALMRSCGKLSLVFVDELGRGTSPKDGTVIAGAVLEEMAKKGMSGIFATHLHGILGLPLNKEALERIKLKRMAIHDSKGERTVNLIEIDRFEWTYRLEDGVCTESLALVTAAKFGLPENILHRANEFISLSPVTSPLSYNDNNGYDVFPPKLDKPTTDFFEANGLSKEKKLVLDDAIRLVETIIDSKFETVRIPPQWMSPSSLEGRTCVYILEIKNQSSHSCESDDSSSTRYYVGETDSLSRRLKQHRAKGDNWALLTAAAIPVLGGKSEARNVESLLIRKMVKSGFDMISVTDGRSIRSDHHKQ